MHPIRTLLLVLPLCAAACAGLESTVKRRAAHDFHCAEDQLKIVDRAATVFRIAGCGSEATYVCTEHRNLRMTCEQADWEKRRDGQAQLEAAATR